MTEKRVLVLTLYSGENELEACKNSVADQQGVKAAHEIFENLPNVEAHRTLYARIMEQAADYDWFVKLDADMVLRSPSALLDAINHIEGQPSEHGMAIFTVQDWPTNAPIWGINFFSPSCRWDWVADGRKIPDQVFVDPDPECEGTRLIVKEAPSPIADHMPSPSDWQAFFFGFHRGLKALQKEGLLPSPRAKIQWNILCKVADHHRTANNRKLALVLAGADYARALEKKRALPDTLNKDNKGLKRHYATLAELSDEALFKKVYANWGSVIAPKIYWYLVRGGLIVALKSKAIKLLKRWQP